MGFLYKILSRKPLFTYIREKHGTPTLRQCRGLEKLIIRYEKAQLDLHFLLTCKKEGLIPKFAQPKLSISAGTKLPKEIAKLIIKAELKSKHKVRKKLRKEIEDGCREIREKTSFLLLNTLRYKIRINVAARRKKWLATHGKKLDGLRASCPKPSNSHNTPRPFRNVVHNFSGYNLSDREYEVLSFSLDHYIPGKEIGKHTQVEFERFYQDILNSTSHLNNLTERERIELKTKFLDTFNRYTRIKLPQEHKKVIEGLYKNPDLSILRQDKGRGVVILNRTDYVRKAEAFLNGPEFVKLEADPTKSFQAYVQRTLCGMKSKFDEKLYQKLYPSSSRPGLYFGLAKMHKLKNGSNNVGELPLRPVISNIGTATYELSKYLAEILKPLTKSEYSIDSTKDFVAKVRSKRIANGYELVSFDVVSLFTKVPLEYTIELILNKIYRDRIVKTKLKREEMKKLLQICTKEMHFSFNDVIYRQVDGVAMGSPLGPVLANVFMVELEKILVPQLESSVALWYRYVDDTFTFIKKGKVEEVLEILNSFHDSIKFTYEKEKDGIISFLDVKVIMKADRTFDTDIHRKQTDTNIYMNWDAFAPRVWKIGTLKGLIRRAFVICSNDEFRNKEISFLKTVFGKINGFPSRVIHNTIRSVKQKIEQEISPPGEEIDTAVEDAEGADDEVKPFICLPYKGKEGEKIVSQFRDALAKALPSNVKPQFAYKGKKIGSYFKLKDQVAIEHQSDCVYAFKQENSTKYVGETSVRFGERTHEHCHTDKKSSVYKYKIQNHVEVSGHDFEILDRGYSRKLNRKLAEALYIKELKPELNEQVKSYKLNLFN